MGAVWFPGQCVNAALVGRRSKFAHQFRAGAIVQKDFAIKAGGGEEFAIGREAHSLDEARVILLGHLELERGSLEHGDSIVFAACNNKCVCVSKFIAFWDYYVNSPVTMRNGLAGRKSAELIDLDWPLISPTDVPVSDIKT